MNYEKKSKILHIILLILGAGYLISGAFHSNLWFDESYTVGLMNENIIDLCKAATFDVHPLGYYIILKLFAYLFGNSIIILRVFSAMCAIMLAVLGFTHIRRDFGPKTGFWFSFFIIAMPSTFKYASQIRMYTCAPLFIVLTAIYAYRMVYQQEKKIKNAILFILFSVVSAYIHYYGLMAVSIMNIMLLIYYIKHHEKLRNWILMAVFQLLGYTPGLYVFYQQFKNSTGSWISVGLHSILDTISFHFLGMPQDDIVLWSPIHILTLCIGAFIYGIFGLLYFKNIRNKHNNQLEIRPVNLALILNFGIIIVFLIVSIVKPMYYVRYLMISYGLMIFAMAYLFGLLQNKYLKVIVIIIMISISIIRAIPQYQENYDASNKNIDNYLAENMKDGDIFVFDAAGAFEVTVKYQNTPTYFYNEWNWNVQKSYKAFGNKVSIIDSLESLRDYSGRIWILDKGDTYKEIMSWYGTKELSNEHISIKYYNSNHDFILIDKK